MKIAILALAAIPFISLAQSVEDVTNYDAFDDTEDHYVLIHGQTGQGGTAQMVIRPKGHSFVTGFDGFICKDHNKPRPSNLFVDYKASIDGEVIDKRRVSMPVSTDRQSLVAPLLFAYGFAQNMRWADDVRIRVVDGCGNRTVLLFKPEMEASEYLKKWYPFKNERACQKAIKKGRKVEQKCSYTGPRGYNEAYLARNESNEDI